MGKSFVIKRENVVELVSGHISCAASDRVTVDGAPIGYIYRQNPAWDGDSGWRFLAGDEDQDYLDDGNVSIFEVNVVANIDRAILPYLNEPVGTRLSRVEGTDTFAEGDEDDEDDWIDVDADVIDTLDDLSDGPDL